MYAIRSYYGQTRELLAGEMSSWRGNLWRLTRRYERWAQDHFTREMADLSASEAEGFQEMLQDVRGRMERLVEGFQGRLADNVRTVITSYSIHYTKLYDEPPEGQDHRRIFPSSHMLRNSLARSRISGPPNRSEITANPDAPARITSRTFCRVIPDMAIAGSDTAPATSAMSFGPRGTSASFLVVVRKIAPTPM